MHGAYSLPRFDPKKTSWTIQQSENNRWFWQRSIQENEVSILESQGGFTSFSDAKNEAVKKGYPKTQDAI